MIRFSHLYMTHQPELNPILCLFCTDTDAAVCRLREQQNVNNEKQTDWSYKSYGQSQVKIRAASNPTTFCSLAYSPDEYLTPFYSSNISPLCNPLAVSTDDLGCCFTEKIEALRLELLSTLISTPAHQTVPTARYSAFPAATRLKCQCFPPRPFPPPLSIRFPTLLAFSRKSLWHLFSLFLSLSFFPSPTASTFPPSAEPFLLVSAC